MEQTQIELMNKDLQHVELYAKTLIQYIVVVREMNKAEKVLQASEMYMQQSGIELTCNNDNPYALRFLNTAKNMGMNFAEALDLLGEVEAHFKETKAQ